MWRVWRKRGGKADACSAARSNQFLEKKYKEIPAEALEAAALLDPSPPSPTPPTPLIGISLLVSIFSGRTAKLTLHK